MVAVPQHIGRSVPRREDLRLLTGRGRYSDDLSLPGQAVAFVLRSPHAHADIVSIDTAAARSAPAASPGWRSRASRYRDWRCAASLLHSAARRQRGP